ncbi:CPBP family intramembrane metalloprotease [Solibacillus sp. R5-41]|uniref:CPBP family intramembrane glutamic endopeptidase n=1 Tax=Solibacillus sp. R5-41 TaxID=2048654 RepID=UPI000C126ECA|nr:type II CAAX endopeptidase family protein [Solibacillus sp. R5-41]ATP40487.1 CPBP family intramembrane metalloprotease [Solibacillus sp. R5-41]
MDLKVNKNYIWVYFIIFFALWCIRELWLVQYLDLMDSIPRAITSAVIKVVIWIIPVLLLVKVMEKGVPLSYLGLRHNFKNGLKWTAWASLIFVSYFIVLNFTILDNNVDFQIGFNEWINTILIVGLTEEIVFRGFLLRKLMDSFKFWIANTITSILFVLIHFPIWFYKGLFELPYFLTASLTVFILGIIFGYVYKKSGSLWSVIVIHSLYNLLVSLFY